MRVCRASGGVGVGTTVRFEVGVDVRRFVCGITRHVVCVVVGVTSGKRTVDATSGKRIRVNMRCGITSRK